MFVIMVRVTTLPKQHPHIPCSRVNTVAGIAEEVGCRAAGVGGLSVVRAEGGHPTLDGQQSSRGAPLAEIS